MAQYEAHRNLAGTLDVPFLLDIQSGFLDRLRTRVVVPLVPLVRFGTPMTRLNPILEVGGEPHVMATTDLAGIDARVLGETVASFEDRHDEIVGAVDFLLQGF